MFRGEKGEQIHTHTLDALEQANGRHGRKRPMKVKPYYSIQSRELLVALTIT